MQLYTQDFYRDVVQAKLTPSGIFVTQSGPAGVLSSTEVFTAIHTTLRSVFPAVLPYAQHIPSYNDAWVSVPVTPLSLHSQDNPNPNMMPFTCPPAFQIPKTRMPG